MLASRISCISEPTLAASPSFSSERYRIVAIAGEHAQDRHDGQQLDQGEAPAVA